MSEEQELKPLEKKGLSISAKSFITAILIIFGLMIVAYVLTFVLPAGLYERNSEGAIIDGSYKQIEGGGLPFYKWILSPFLILGSSAGLTTIVVVIFLLIIGGIFSSLNSIGLFGYMVDKIVFRFYKAKYLLLAVLSFFFMAMGSLIGSFEEVVPLVPIIIALSVKLGWDAFIGLGMSLLSVGCGFAAGVFNPFTVGVAQKYANLPMFSGAWLRILSFFLIYALLFGLLYLYAKKHDKGVTSNLENEFNGFQKNPKFDRGMICFLAILGLGILIVFSSSFITALQDYTTIVIALMFFVAGIVSALVSGMSFLDLLKTFGKGALGMLPAALMVLMASSIKYILEESQVLDTILHGSINIVGGMPKWSIVLFIYLLVLVMNFFIPSGSAKAAMLIPLIVPLALVMNIPAQLCIVAFAFGDGFSNVFYPTNPVLLISLGLTDISYGKWIKFSWKFQLLNLILTSGILMLGLAVGYC